MVNNKRLQYQDLYIIFTFLILILTLLIFYLFLSIIFTNSTINMIYDIVIAIVSMIISSLVIFGILVVYIKIRDYLFTNLDDYHEIDLNIIELSGEKKVDLDAKTFVINDYITLKLEFGKTQIYLNNELFINCKYLLLNIPKEDIILYDEVESIDDAMVILDNSLEQDSIYNYSITPDQEFVAHCSNIQTWYENDYNTRILHSNLSFPLLKKLTELGDKTAKVVFSDEIVSRYIEGNESVRNFLKEEYYLSYLNKEQLKFLVTELIERENKIDIKVTMISYFDGTEEDDYK